MKKLTILIICLGLFFISNAQKLITTTGGTASGTSGTVSYTVGQINYHTQSGTNGSVAEGVQQPFEISVFSSIKETDGITLNIMAYPNPTSACLTLDIIDFDMKNLSIELFDINGKLLKTENITNAKTNIDISKLNSASYLIKVIRDNKEVKTFKIIKK
ncbi:T9SS type A sorting domain-containing protein [Saccharicrinis sp. FJH62]|uniref:T9SS type A sorting domain-containing protein n=1 Tax=Saccharicrinis sp. FJH62 TaxID=3344657 RepID=UPI0035D503DA